MFILYLFSGLSISDTINVLNLFMSFTYKISSNIYCSLYPNFLSFSYKQTQKAPLPQQGSIIAGKSFTVLSGKSFNLFYRQLQYLLQFSIISWQMLIGVSISARFLLSSSCVGRVIKINLYRCIGVKLTQCFIAFSKNKYLFKKLST